MHCLTVNSAEVKSLVLRALGRVAWVRDGIQGLFSPKVSSLSPLSEYTFRSGKQIFVFSVWGRASTTALQRILNSSGEVCMWGEPGEFIVDDLAKAICYLQKKNAQSPLSDARKQVLQRAFRERDHSVPYALAFPELQPAIDHLCAAFAQLFPPVADVKRIGFKEIRVRGRETLEALHDLFFIHRLYLILPVP